MGCATAGEIGPAGYLQHSLSRVSFSSNSFSAVSGLLDGLKGFEISRAYDFVQDLLQRLESKVPQADADN